MVRHVLLRVALTLSLILAPQFVSPARGQQDKEARQRIVTDSVDIANDTTWENEEREIRGRVRVRDGMTLRIIDSIVRFRSTTEARAGILLQGNAGLVMKDSEITAAGVNVENVREMGWFLVAGSIDPQGEQPLIDETGRKLLIDDNRFILSSSLPAEEPRTLVQIENCRLLNIGGYRFPRSGPAIWFWKVRRGSYVRHSLFENPAFEKDSAEFQANPRGYVSSHAGHTIFVWRSGAFIEIAGNRFRNLGLGIRVYGEGYETNSFLPIHGNDFKDVLTPIDTGRTSRLALQNNRYDNNFSDYCINIWGHPQRQVYIAGETEMNVVRPIVLNADVTDVLVENVTQHHIPGSLVALNVGIQRVIVRNCTADDVYDLGAGVVGIRNKDNLFYGLSATNVRGNGINYVGHDSAWVDCMLSGTPGKSGITLTRRADPRTQPGGKFYSEGVRDYCVNVTYANIRLADFNRAIQITWARDCLFKDISTTGIREHDIFLGGNNSNVKFINVQFSPDSVFFADEADVFEPFWYCDVFVVDIEGHPIPDATVTIANEVAADRPALNRLGEAKTAFRTGEDGHTPLPIPYVAEKLVLQPPITYDEDGYPLFPEAGHKLLPMPTDAETIVLGGWKQTKAGTQAYAYTIGAARAGYQSSEAKHVSPDCSWFRSDVTAPPQTVTIQLRRLPGD